MRSGIIIREAMIFSLCQSKLYVNALKENIDILYDRLLYLVPKFEANQVLNYSHKNLKLNVPH